MVAVMNGVKAKSESVEGHQVIIGFIRHPVVYEVFSR